jgi:hypothetical protein
MDRCLGWLWYILLQSSFRKQHVGWRPQELQVSGRWSLQCNECVRATFSRKLHQHRILARIPRQITCWNLALERWEQVSFVFCYSVVILTAIRNLALWWHNVRHNQKENRKDSTLAEFERNRKEIYFSVKMRNLKEYMANFLVALYHVLQRGAY